MGVVLRQQATIHLTGLEAQVERERFRVSYLAEVPH